MSDDAIIIPRFEAARRLLQEGRLKDAHDACTLLRNEFPNRFPILHLSGAVCNTGGRFQEALTYFDQALSLEDNHFQTHLYRGEALFGLGLIRDAAQAVERSLALNDKSADTYVLRARLHQDRLDGIAAIKDLDTAIELMPEDLSIRTLKVQMLRFLGRKADAIRDLEGILADHPHYVPALYGMAITRDFAPGDPITDTVQTLLQRDDLHVMDRVKLLFARAKIHDDCGEPAAAMEQFQAANTLRRSLNSKPQSWVLDIRGLAAMYGAPGFFANAPFTARGDVTPVFIVGLPRSGSTLVEQILNAHPDVQSYGETDHLSHSLANILVDRTGSDQFSALPHLKEADLDAIREDYLNRLQQHAPLASFVVDKSLANMISVAAIRYAFPQAKVIYCRRDVRDMGLSIYFNYFGDEDNTIAFSHRLEDIAIQARSYDAMALIWESTIPGFVASLSYETLVTDFEPTVRRLLAHCGLDWHDACLSFQPKDKPVRTISTMQVREGINQKGIGKWKPYEAYIGPLIACAEEADAQAQHLPHI